MYTLRPYQEQAVYAGVEYMTGKSSGGAIIVLPTGSGKSLVIANIAQQLDAPTLIFQPSKEILEQNFNKYINYGGRATIYSASFNSKKISDTTFATIGSTINHPDQFKDFRYVIVDECHGVNAKNGMYKTFLSLIGDKVLGLTATPYRLVTDGYGGSILKFLTRTRPRVFNSVIHVTQNGALFEAGHLAQLKYKAVDGFDSSRLRLNSTGADYTDDSVKSYYQTIGFVGRVENIVKTCLQHNRRSILVFTRFVEEARQLSKVFGNIAAMVNAKTPKKERADIISKFRSGAIKIVANVGILTTGFDFPELETIVIARPTMSLALYYQMIGRGMRPHPNKDCTWIIDLCDNITKFGRVENLELVEPRRGLWHIENNGKQLTNIYFGDRPPVYAHH